MGSSFIHLIRIDSNEFFLMAASFDILNDSEFMLKLGWNIQQTQFKKK